MGYLSENEFCLKNVNTNSVGYWVIKAIYNFDT